MYMYMRMEVFTGWSSQDAASRYFSYKDDRPNIKTNGDIHTVRVLRYVYRDTNISVWNWP